MNYQNTTRSPSVRSKSPQRPTTPISPIKNTPIRDLSPKTGTATTDNTQEIWKKTTGTLKVDATKVLKNRESTMKPKAILQNAIKVDMLSVLKSRQQNIKTNPYDRGSSTSSQSSQSTGSRASSKLGDDKLSIKSLPISTTDKTLISESTSPTVSEPAINKDKEMSDSVGMSSATAEGSTASTTVSSQRSTKDNLKVSPMKALLSPQKYGDPNFILTNKASPLSTGSPERSLGKKSAIKDQKQYKDIVSWKSSIATIPIPIPLSGSSSAVSNTTDEKPLPTRRMRKSRKSNSSSSLSDDLSSSEEDIPCTKEKKTYLIGRLRQTESEKSSHYSRRRERRQWHTESEKMSECEYQQVHTKDEESQCVRSRKHHHHHHHQHYDKVPEVECQFSTLRREPSLISAATVAIVKPSAEICHFLSRINPDLSSEPSVLSADESILSPTNGSSNKFIMDGIFREQTQQFQQQLEEQKQLQLQLQKQQKIQMELQKQQQQLQKQLLHLQQVPSPNDNKPAQVKEIPFTFKTLKDILAYPTTSISSEKSDASPSPICESLATVLVEPLNPPLKNNSELSKSTPTPTTSMIKTLQEILNAKQKLKSGFSTETLQTDEKVTYSSYSNINLIDGQNVGSTLTIKSVHNKIYSSKQTTLSDVYKSKENLSRNVYDGKRSKEHSTDNDPSSESSPTIKSISSYNKKPKQIMIDNSIDDDLSTGSRPSVMPYYNKKKNKYIAQIDNDSNDNSSLSGCIVKYKTKQQMAPQDDFSNQQFIDQFDSSMRNSGTDDQQSMGFIKSAYDKKKLKADSDKRKTMLIDDSDVHSLGSGVSIKSASRKKPHQTNAEFERDFRAKFCSVIRSGHQAAVASRYKKEAQRVFYKFESDEENEFENPSGDTASGILIDDNQTSSDETLTSESKIRIQDQQDLKQTKRKTLRKKYSSTSLFSTSHKMATDRSSPQKMTSKVISMKKQVINDNERGKSFSPARNSKIDRKSSVSPTFRVSVFDIANKKNVKRDVQAEWKDYATTDDESLVSSLQSKIVISTEDGITPISRNMSIEQAKIASQQEESALNKRQSRSRVRVNNVNRYDSRRDKRNLKGPNVIENKVEQPKPPAQSKLRNFFQKIDDAVANLETYMEIDPAKKFDSTTSELPGPSKLHSDRGAGAVAAKKRVCIGNEEDLRINLISQKQSGKWRRPLMSDDRSMTDAEDRIRRRHTVEPDVRRKTKDDESIQNKDLKRKMMAIERDQRLNKLKKNMKREWFSPAQSPTSTRDSDNSSTSLQLINDDDDRNKNLKRKDENQIKAKFIDKRNVTEERKQDGTRIKSPIFNVRQKYQNDLSEGDKSSKDRRQSPGMMHHKGETTLKKGFGDVEDRKTGNGEKKLQTQVKLTTMEKMESLKKDRKKIQFREGVENVESRVKHTDKTRSNTRQMKTDVKLTSQKMMDPSESSQNAGKEEELSSVTTSLSCMGDTKPPPHQMTASANSATSTSSVPSDKTLENPSLSESSIDQMMLRLPSHDEQFRPTNSRFAMTMLPDDSPINSGEMEPQSNMVRSVCNLSSTFKKFITAQGNSEKAEAAEEHNSENEEFAVAVVSKKSNWINQNVVVQSLDKISTSLWRLVGGKKKKQSGEEQDIDEDPDEELDEKIPPKSNNKKINKKTGKETILKNAETQKSSEEEAPSRHYGVIIKDSQNPSTDVRIQFEPKTTSSQKQKINKDSGKSQDTIIITTNALPSIKENTSTIMSPHSSHYAIAVVNGNEKDEKDEKIEKKPKTSETITSGNFVISDINNNDVFNYLKPISNAIRQCNQTDDNQPSNSQENTLTFLRADSTMSAKAESIVAAMLGATGNKRADISAAGPSTASQSASAIASTSTSIEKGEKYNITVVVMEPIGVTSPDDQNWQAKEAIDRTLDKLLDSLKNLADKQKTEGDVMQTSERCERIIAAVDESMFSVTMILMDPVITQTSTSSGVPNVNRISNVTTNAVQDQIPGNRRALSMSRITSWSQVKQMDSEDFSGVIDDVLESPAPYFEPEGNRDFLDVDMVELELKDLQLKKKDAHL